MMRRRALGGLGLGLLLIGVGCAGPPPVVDALRTRDFDGDPGRLVVLPVELAEGVVERGPEKLRADVLAGLLESLRAAGYSVAGVAATAAPAAGLRSPEQLYRGIQQARRHFAADHVMRLQVHRFREREGGEFGTLRPASIDCVLTLYAAPGGERRFRARFDETQISFSGDLMRAWRYPGRGLRWLDADALLRFGLDAAVASLVDAPIDREIPARPGRSAQ